MGGWVSVADHPRLLAQCRRDFGAAVDGVRRPMHGTVRAGVPSPPSKRPWSVMYAVLDSKQVRGAPVQQYTDTSGALREAPDGVRDGQSA